MNFTNQQNFHVQEILVLIQLCILLRRATLDLEKDEGEKQYDDESGRERKGHAVSIVKRRVAKRGVPCGTPLVY